MADQETAKRPYMIVEEHDGSRLFSIPERGINREMMGTMVYGGTTTDDRMIWHWFGNFTDVCEVVAYMFEQNPGMEKVVEGLIQMRQATRAARKAAEEKSI